MRKLVFVSAIVVSFAVMACVGDDPPSPISGIAQGELGGACFANGTCNGGLACNAGKCAATSSSSSASSSSSSSGAPIDTIPDSGTNADTGPVGPLVCKFQTTSYPCKDPTPPVACFGDTQTCTLTGCGGASDLRWECNSARQCNNTVCCIATDKATVAAGANCAEGTLLMKVGAVAGPTCVASLACPAGTAQLCQANADCPAGEHCTPLKIANGGAALNGNIIAACVK